MADTFLYLTELQGLPVYDLRQRLIGRVRDAAVLPVVDPFRIDRYLVGGGGFTWLTIRFDQVSRISIDGIHLKDEQLRPYHDDENMLRMVRDLLDQQIIDVDGRKVVRVTDVTFDILQDCFLRVVDIDVGVRSIFRRLFQGVLPKPWIRRLQQPIPPHSIRWEVCNILEPDPQRRLRLNISHSKLEEIHPADLADIVEELSPEDRESIFRTLDSEVAAEALSEMEDPKLQAQILEALEPEEAAAIVEEMAPDEAADVLGELEEATTEEILEEMEIAPETEVRELMEFPENTAGGMMTTEYISLPQNAAVADAVRALRGNEEMLESVNTLFLVDADGRLRGSVALARLFAASDNTPLEQLATELLVRVSVKEKQDRVTELFDKYNLLTLPVVDEDGCLSGVITADDIITVLRQR